MYNYFLFSIFKVFKIFKLGRLIVNFEIDHLMLLILLIRIINF